MKKNIVICCVLILIASMLSSAGTFYIQRYVIEKNRVSLSKTFKIDVDFDYEIENSSFKINANNGTATLLKISFDKQYTESFIKALEKSSLNYEDWEVINIPDELIAELPFSPELIPGSKMYHANGPMHTYRVYPRLVIVDGLYSYYILLKENEQNTEVFLVKL